MVSNVDILGLGQGKSIYSKEQMEVLVQFQNSQNTTRVFLAETAELAYLGRKRGQWGQPDLLKDQIIDAMRYHLIPLIQAGRINGHYHHPYHVCGGYGEDALRYCSASQIHSPSLWMWLLDVWSTKGYRLSSGSVSHKVGRGEKKVRC
jgi:hypothetical protein